VEQNGTKDDRAKRDAVEEKDEVQTAIGMVRAAVEKYEDEDPPPDSEPEAPSRELSGRKPMSDFTDAIP